MFDWLQFSPERLSNPIIIVAICLAIVGMVGVLYFSGQLKRGNNGAKTTAIGVVSTIIMLVGVLLAVLVA